MKRLAVALVAWVASRLGYRMLETTKVVQAQMQAAGLVLYAHQSGALNHPKRVKARQRLIATATAIAELLQ